MAEFLGMDSLQWAAIQAICSFLGLLGIAILITQVWVAYSSSKHQVYGVLSKEYSAYIKESLPHPDMRTHDLDFPQVDWYSNKYHRGCRDISLQEIVKFEILFSLWEHAFLEWKRKWMDKTQWTGWHQWIYEFLNRAEENNNTHRRVLDAWFISAHTYDEYFLQYVADFFVRPILKVGKDDDISLLKENLPPGPWPVGLETEDNDSVLFRRKLNKKLTINNV